MVFQWYLFLLVIVSGWLAKYTGMTESVLVNGRKEVHYTWTPVLVIVIPMIITAALRASDIGDTSAYIIGFRNTVASFEQIPKILEMDGKDKGFSIFNILIKMLIGDHYQLYFAIIAATCLLCIAKIYRKYSCNFAMSMFLFIASADYIQWTHNGMRQFIAVAVIFFSTDLLLAKKYLQYYAVILLMSTIHASALIMIPVSLFVLGKSWNLRTIVFTILTLIAINFSDVLSELIVSFMLDTQYSNEVNQFLATDGTNILRVIVFALPPLLSLVFRRYIDAVNQSILDLSVNMSIVSMGAYIVSAVTSGIFVGRIPIYFSLYNYILLPWLVENIFEEKSQKLVFAAVIICYLYFYYYQVAVTWNL